MFKKLFLIVFITVNLYSVDFCKELTKELIKPLPRTRIDMVQVLHTRLFIQEMLLKNCVGTDKKKKNLLIKLIKETKEIKDTFIDN